MKSIQEEIWETIDFVCLVECFIEMGFLDGAVFCCAEPLICHQPPVDHIQAQDGLLNDFPTTITISSTPLPSSQVPICRTDILPPIPSTKSSTHIINWAVVKHTDNNYSFKCIPAPFMTQPDSYLDGAVFPGPPGRVRLIWEEEKDDRYQYNRFLELSLVSKGFLKVIQSLIISIDISWNIVEFVDYILKERYKSLLCLFKYTEQIVCKLEYMYEDYEDECDKEESDAHLFQKLLTSNQWQDWYQQHPKSIHLHIDGNLGIFQSNPYITHLTIEYYVPHVKHPKYCEFPPNLKELRLTTHPIVQADSLNLFLRMISKIMSKPRPQMELFHLRSNFVDVIVDEGATKFFNYLDRSLVNIKDLSLIGNVDSRFDLSNNESIDEFFGCFKRFLERHPTISKFELDTNNFANTESKFQLNSFLFNATNIRDITVHLHTDSVPQCDRIIERAEIFLVPVRDNDIEAQIKELQRR
ncbi:hypothetical protein PPL_02364 [Heterostelium album PN500]|uniref:Uncharacterized protein n=1 Tax=Heterostelium pallidum (strain ATCC 26659 / Pp 5 / PN500) TaxID=670386 RepID=D3AZI2_HETP5|nr:hypothetical protein PPL_02364 [Heterostelium album PN500]EFA85361.1 hypothetical protein PPL_02364 [Heterostelium album PN500]|eukprot:XP_020437470.1 hypothetical protein PPL_02364 [Heterostelium album PN500]